MGMQINSYLPWQLQNGSTYNAATPKPDKVGSPHTNFNWGQGMAALQTIQQNFGILSSLSTGDDRGTLINEDAINAGRSGNTKEAGNTPMSLKDALDTVANNPELKAFLEDRSGGAINDRYGGVELNAAVSELGTLEGAYNSAQIKLGSGQLIDINSKADDKEFSFKAYVQQLLQKIGGNAESATADQLKAAGMDPLMLFDKTATGGNGDGVLSADELTAGLKKMDHDSDGKLGQKEQATIFNPQNSINQEYIQ